MSSLLFNIQTHPPMSSWLIAHGGLLISQIKRSLTRGDFDTFWCHDVLSEAEACEVDLLL